MTIISVDFDQQDGKIVSILSSEKSHEEYPEDEAAVQHDTRIVASTTRCRVRFVRSFVRSLSSKLSEWQGLYNGNLIKELENPAGMALVVRLGSDEVVTFLSRPRTTKIPGCSLVLSTTLQPAHSLDTVSRGKTSCWVRTAILLFVI